MQKQKQGKSKYKSKDKVKCKNKKYGWVLMFNAYLSIFNHRLG